ncbi:hypothetical protein HMPREF0080_00502 [Anaeroglobus geminatus F0357]|uniref:Uncharacterized protein n=1 Tax=Anaeroglobus geminatus F0357 TaxID=861450 RepID=G9YFU0_9FIRM|nr:hypothetical protein HMPREF0080_00502 [Anaeroglobus geminatus F0357]
MSRTEYSAQCVFLASLPVRAIKEGRFCGSALLFTEFYEI